MVIEAIGGGWGEAIAKRLESSRHGALEEFLANAWLPGQAAVYPPKAQVFAALEKTPLHEVRAVILGQDPYPTYGQACGLAFSVPKVLAPEVRRPQSLGRILAELRREAFSAPKNATLEPWTDNGVLLLNAALTVRAGDPGCHAETWRHFTTAVIEALVEQPDPVAFLLWGKHAQEWRSLVRSPHVPVCSPHPAARGRAESFGRSSPFSRANAVLGDERKIDWSLG